MPSFSWRRPAPHDRRRNRRRPRARRPPGTAWNAVELGGTAVAAGSGGADRAPHLIFGADGRVSGSDGCNRLTSSYTAKGEAITFGLFAATQMACADTDERASRFRSALGSTSHWRIEKGRLQLYGATGKPLAVFEPRATSPLEDTTWQLVKFTGADDTVLTPSDPSKYTIAFATAGQVTTQVDCNRGRGSWKATPAGQLEFGPLALTRALCRDPKLPEQIARHWTSITSFVMRNGHLFLSLKADGGIYEFAPVAPKKPPIKP